MIVSAFVITRSVRTASTPKLSENRAVLNLADQPCDIEINFENPITAFRTHDYRWGNADVDHIAGEFAPKIVKLANGCFVQPGTTVGIWEFNCKSPRQLLWRFNPDDAVPLTKYSGPESIKTTEKANFPLPESVTLLFSFTGAVEFSRSAVPFSAIACFTDHCDFDTPDSLIRQREFFKQAGIRVTKGFFLNHFSKREDNASIERDRTEFEKWRADGHELAYHSLSQSIKSNEDSFRDFENFTPPCPDLPTWIDHGFQPYNLSLYAQYGITDDRFASIMKSKGIETLWNYIDSGTATEGVINQLNPSDFTLAAFAKGNATLSAKSRWAQLVKAIMFHFYADEEIIQRYKRAAGNLKRLVYQKKIASIGPLVANFARVAAPIGRVLVHWHASKDKPFKLAKHTPIVFKHRIAGRDFYIFQTLEMTDFARSLSPTNIDKLIAESGLFIAHTYFSVPAVYHHGRMFARPDQINPKVAGNFINLGQKVKTGEIWNPTLGELVRFLANFEHIRLETEGGQIIVRNDSGLPYRKVI